MVVKKTHAVKILIFSLCLMLVFSFPLTVSAAVGVGSLWDGVVSVDTVQPYLYVDNTYVIQSTYDSLNIRPYITEVVYHANQNARINIDSNYTDCFLNGTLRKRITVTPQMDLSTGAMKYITPYCEPVIINGVYISIEVIEQAETYCIFDIILEFDNYYIDQSEFSFPLNIQYNLNAFFLTNEIPSLSSLWCTFDATSDYAGDIMKYERLEDVPSVDGYMSQQNQTIINQSQTQIQNQEIQNQLQEQQNQLQSQENQLQQESNQQNKNFMDNFFSNLGNTVLGWIVPSSEDLTTFLDSVNAWFSDRLGFVWYPFDLAYQLVSAFTQGEPNSMFKVPGFTMNFQGQQLQIWQPLEVDIDAFDIFKYVRYFTSALLACGVAHLAINKWDEWIGGHNS